MKKFITKKFIFGLSFILISAFAQSQNGMQNLIVEKYYVANADDAAGSVGTLPVGSVTYRIFVDMLPGYKFNLAYGSPTHTLFINTTTSFFNNEDRGAIFPTYTKAQAKNNTVMLDSWVTVGAACVGNLGILKTEDDGVANVVNADGILQNADPSVGIPLTTQDGLIAGSPSSIITLGIDSALAVFDATSQFGNSFSTANGGWSSLVGAVGPDSTNKVLIAQITTDGELTFELNIQIVTPTFTAERYVANNPIGDEIKLDCLTFSSLHVSTETIQGRESNVLTVFPNPTSDIVTLNISSLNSNSDNYYTIYDLLGNVLIKKNIKSKSGSYNEIIDMSSFTSGMYIMDASINGERITKKLIKK